MKRMGIVLSARDGWTGPGPRTHRDAAGDGVPDHVVKRSGLCPCGQPDVLTVSQDSEHRRQGIRIGVPEGLMQLGVARALLQVEHDARMIAGFRSVSLPILMPCRIRCPFRRGRLCCSRACATSAVLISRTHQELKGHILDMDRLAPVSRRAALMSEGIGAWARTLAAVPGRSNGLGSVSRLPGDGT